MTDVAGGEAHIEDVPLAPDVATEVDAPPSDAAEAPGTSAAERVIPELEHPIGPLRQAVLDHLLDSVEAGPQSVAQILAALPPGTSRNTAESAIKRCFDAGQIERVAPGTYVLAKPAPAEPPKPTASPEPVSSDGHTAEEWLAALEAFFVDPTSWDVERFGPSPDQPSNRIPPDIATRMNDRLRKREERRRDREAAAARQAEADRALRDALLAACRHGPSRDQSTPALVADDLAPIRAVLRLGVPLKRIERAIAWRTDNDRLTTWRDEKLLRKAGEYFWRFDVLPTLMSVGKAPGRTADASEASPAVSHHPPTRKAHWRRPRRSPTRLPLIVSASSSSAPKI